MKIKNRIKQFLFYLNRCYAKLYYQWKIRSANGTANLSEKILFVIDDSTDSKQERDKRQIFTDFKKRCSGIKLIYLSEILVGSENHVLEIIRKECIGIDWFWLDTNQCYPLSSVFEFLNSRFKEGSQAFTFDTYNSKLGKPIFKPDFSLDEFLDLDYLEGAVLFAKESLTYIPEKELDSLSDLYLNLVLGIIKNQGFIRSIKQIGFLSYLKPSVRQEHQQKITAIYNEKNFGTKIQYFAKIENKTYIKYDIKKPLVSIIIPFRDKVELLKVIVESILKKSRYEKYEILLVSNQSKEFETLDYLSRVAREVENIKILEYDDIFNFSAINNFAASKAKGEALFFLNNDTEIITSDFLEIMTSYAMNDAIGGVGPKLLFEDGSIQHAGVILGLTGMAEHAFKEMRNDDHLDSFGSVQWTRNYLALTAAALMVEKAKFWKVGGFNEKLVVCGNDVNLGIKLHEAGYRNVYLPQVEMYHFESKSRKGAPIPLDDFKESIKSYSRYLENGDPFFHPKLSLNLPWFTYNFSEIPSCQRNLKRLKKIMPEIFSN